MTEPTSSWRRILAAAADPAPLAIFGGYALVVVAVLALASTGSAIGMLGVGGVLAAVIGVLVWWAGDPQPVGSHRHDEAADMGASAKTEAPDMATPANPRTMSKEAGS